MIGTSRIRDLYPVGHNGQWGQDLTPTFGFTLYDSAGGAFTLERVTAVKTSPTGTRTEETVHDGVAFGAAWSGAGSSYNPATGEFLAESTAAITSGTMIEFTVRASDGTNTTYISWCTGIGDPPGHGSVGEGSIVRSRDGKIWRVVKVVGEDGHKRYRAECCDRTVPGYSLFRVNDVTLVGPRDRLDVSITVSE